MGVSVLLCNHCHDHCLGCLVQHNSPRLFSFQLICYWKEQNTTDKYHRFQVVTVTSKLAWTLCLSGCTTDLQCCRWLVIEGALGMRDPFRSKLFHFRVVFGKHFVKQECIPVECVPLARYRKGEISAWGCPRQRPHWTATLLDGDDHRQKSPWTETPPPTCGACWDRDPLWTEWHTGVKTLPYCNFIAGSNNRLEHPPLRLPPPSQLCEILVLPQVVIFRPQCNVLVRSCSAESIWLRCNNCC